jgi:hypothetical protein
MYKKSLKRIDDLLEKANKKQTSPAIEEIKTLLTDAKTQIIGFQLLFTEAGWNDLMKKEPVSCKSIKDGINSSLADAERALRA